jgi:hypothetical protein
MIGEIAKPGRFTVIDMVKTAISEIRGTLPFPELTYIIALMITGFYLIEHSQQSYVHFSASPLDKIIR